VDRRAFLRAAGGGITAAAVVACSRSRSLVDPAVARPEPRPLVSNGFLFATGIENSYPRLADGARHDQLEQGGHYERWRDDFGLARSLGVDALRYGPAWYRTNPAPGRYDWSSVDDQMAWLRGSRLTVIADLCHFGAPDWIDGFQDPALPLHLAAYAREFAKRYPWVRHYTPVNEIFVAANFSAMVGWWNERATGAASFARALRNLSMGHELAVEAVLAERPDAIIVQAESFEHFTPADASAEAAAEAQFWNEARFAALDLTLGRMPSPRIRDLLLASGMTTTDFAFLHERRARGRRWIGVDYYVTSEQTIDGDGRKRPTSTRLGLAAVVQDYYDRYRAPLFLSETSRVASRGVEWLDEQWRECRSLLSAGIPLEGFTWFPLGDVVDWRHSLREKRGDVDPIGLYDPQRAAHPAAGAYARLIASLRTVGARPHTTRAAV
jgi:beta-glucosidase/6-phospho-beta-glucosidase/beta-galactosidase